MGDKTNEVYFSNLATMSSGYSEWLRKKQEHDAIYGENVLSKPGYISIPECTENAMKQKRNTWLNNRRKWEKDIKAGKSGDWFTSTPGYICKLCGKVYIVEYYYKQHIRDKHNSTQ